MNDLESDPDIMFQHKYYLKVVLTVSAVIPTLITSIVLGETLATAFFLNVFRYIVSLHITWLINSAAHMFGTKPFDK